MYTYKRKVIMDSFLSNVKPVVSVVSAPASVLGAAVTPILGAVTQPFSQAPAPPAPPVLVKQPPTPVLKPARMYDWKSQSFLWLALILFLVLFIWAWVSYDPDQRIFTIYNIAQNATYDFPRFSGQILIHDANQGSVTEWLVGGSAATLIGCSMGCDDTADPDSGLITYNASIDGYTWTQTQFAGLTTYTFITNRIVKNA
jgi:hypothetical protein